MLSKQNEVLGITMMRNKLQSTFTRFRHWPKIPLGLRLFLFYFVLVILTTYLISSTVMHEIKPTVRQVSEDILIDMSNLLAVMVRDDMVNGTLSNGQFVQQIKDYDARKPKVAIGDVNKSGMSYRIYITNNKGIVVADSWQQDLGADFSRWNDVYLTLKGQYGARTTALDPDDILSTIMYVAAPIIDQGHIIGSVTVAKANRSVQPFITNTRYKILTWFIVVSILGLLIGALFAWRINLALYKLSTYAEQMGRGEKSDKPRFRIFYEYGFLGDALEKMRNQLDGKQYVEHYVQTLTHELKSPLSAIRGASEILQMPELSADKQQLFANNIENETARMQQLIDKLLTLTKLEQQPELAELKPIQVTELITSIKASLISKVTTKKAQIIFNEKINYRVMGEVFLLQQALYNILDNALDFVFEGSNINIKLTPTETQLLISISNHGPLIPDYALTRVTERFYSLARANGKKSTGLGLNFVEQVTKLHKGQLHIFNIDKGVCVQISLPTP